jgi:hypothetical protein
VGGEHQNLLDLGGPSHSQSEFAAV